MKTKTLQNRLQIIAAVVLLNLIASTAVFAGDTPSLNFIGFSKDARFLAFEEYGTRDGSGFAYSRVQFVDVDHNSFVGQPVAVEAKDEKLTEPAARAKAAQAAAAQLGKFKIAAGNTGDLLLAHLLTDLSLNGKTIDFDQPESARFLPQYISGGLERGAFRLTLQPSAAVNVPKNCQPFASEYKLQQFALQLENEASGASQTLQKDVSLPVNRGCAFHYRIERVYFYQNRIAVFLNVFSPGFEGSDTRHLIVTGTIKKV